jgi:four helix bundle protein
MKSYQSNPLKEKTFDFALRIVKLYKYLCSEHNEYIISKQLLRSGTSIGAMQRESEHAESKPDFIHKLSIAQKECNESLYWIELLYRSEYMTEEAFVSINADAEEIMKLITSIIKKMKSSISN